MQQPRTRLGFGRAIRSLRVQRRWTQEELASLVGTSQSELSNLERGEGAKDLLLRLRPQLAKMLGVSDEELAALAEALSF